MARGAFIPFYSLFLWKISQPRWIMYLMPQGPHNVFSPSQFFDTQSCTMCNVHLCKALLVQQSNGGLGLKGFGSIWRMSLVGLLATRHVYSTACGDLLIPATLKMVNYPAISQPCKLQSSKPFTTIELFHHCLGICWHGWGPTEQQGCAPRPAPPWAPPTPPVGCPGPSVLCLKFINAKTIEKSWVGCVGNVDLLMCRKFSEAAVVPNSELGNRSNLHSP